MKTKRTKFTFKQMKMKNHESVWSVIFLKNTRSNSGEEEYKSLNNTTFERKLC